MAQACWICDLGSPQVIGGLKENKARKPPFFTINQWGSYGSAGMLLFNCGKLLIPYFSGCGYWCRTYCNLSFALDRVRVQDMSIFWVFVFLLGPWPPPGCPNHHSINGLNVVSCEHVFHVLFLKELWVLKRLRCLTLFFGGPILHMHQPKQKQITKFEVKLVGGHPFIFTFLSMALCGALCYTENSTTAKLDFDKRHRDCITYSHCFFLCAITAPKLVCSGFVFSWA